MSETPAHAPRLVQFGVYELDLHSGELRKSGARLTLQQQPLQLLSVLLEQPGELVTRDELRKRLWPDDTFVDFEHGLNAAVKRLRDTLGDSADSPRFVETVPRRGYRFIAPTNLPDSSVARTTPAAGRWRVGWVWMIVGVAVAAAIALGAWALRKPPLREMAAVDVTSPRGPAGPVTHLTSGSDLNTEPAVSPDGEWVAYASDRSGEGNLDIWMQRLSGGEAVRLTRDAADEREPAFSADGSRLAFRSEREGGGVYVMPAHSGGEARLLVPRAHGPRFSPDGRWLAYSTGPGRFSMDKALGFTAQTYLIPTAGGEATRLLPDFASVAWPVWSPDGRRLLVTARSNVTDDPEWWVVTLDGQAPVKNSGVTVVTPGAAQFPVRPWTWIEGDRIVYSVALGGDSWDLWEVGLSPDTWVVSTEPRRLTTGADLQAHASIVGARLVFSSLTQTINVWRLPLDPNDSRVVGPARRVTATSALQWWPSVSDDGRRLLFRGDKGGLWIRDFDAGREVLLASSQRPIAGSITADGSRVAYVVFEEKREIFAVPSSGGGSEKLCAECGDSFLEAWSKDKTRLLYESGNPSEVFVLDLRSGEKRRALHRRPNNIWNARFSPDDRWISVTEVLEVEGRSRVWIAQFRDGSSPEAHQWIGVTSGEHWDDKPRWSTDGTLMYFTSLRDGFHCLWSQRLRPDTKEPTGQPICVKHFHDPRLSMTNTGVLALDVAVARDAIFINLGELSGNIWTTSLR
jgi:Tol biopolymer transport system component/DNA-binding winged helix-turn-helix (wHTH) protein